jgi:glycine cleavage system H protein
MSTPIDFPPDLHYDVEHQTWARVEADGLVTAGISALGIRLSGELYMCRPKAAGQRVERGRSMAVVELAKSIVSVKAPVSGEVVQVNPLLEDHPDLVHRDPYGQGWLMRLRPDAWNSEAAALLQGPSVPAAMREHARLHRLEWP